MSHNTNSIRTLAALGATAILARCTHGIYEIMSGAAIESWADVIESIAGDESAVRVDAITGHGDYTNAVHISIIDTDADTEELMMTVVYLVA